MRQKRFLIILFILLTAVSFIFASLALASSALDITRDAQDQAPEDDETLAEKAKALAAEQMPAQSQKSVLANSGGNIGELFIGVDDPTINAYTVDVNTNEFFTAFVGVDVWGAAYDPTGNRIFFNDGSVLWEWPVGGSPTMLGTITINGAAAAMVGLAYYNGTLYASRNIGTEDIYAIDTNTLAATVAITLVPPTTARDLGGIDFDLLTGQLYGTNDAATLRGLVQIDPDGTMTVIAPYPAGETDIDGLAVGEGKAYLITDEPGLVYVFDLGTMTYTTPLNNPWTTSEIFAGGAWISLSGPHIGLEKTVGTDPGVCASSDIIDVVVSTTVTYCYKVFNTGAVTFTLHTLDDSESGNILSGFNFSLVPGASAYLTQTAVITQTTINTATWTAYNAGPTDIVSDTDSATVEVLLVPEIEVNPASFSISQAPDTQVIQTLTISNVGTGDLNWDITEEPSQANFGNTEISDARQVANLDDGNGTARDSASAPTVSSGVALAAQTSLFAPTGNVLHDNGSLVNSPGTGVGGADESVLQTVSLGMTTLGFGHQAVNGNRIADDFTIPPGGNWTIDEIVFYAYQTGSSTASTITEVNLRIWDGEPGNGGNVIWGDTSTNIMTSTVWSGIYRVTETTIGTAANRPIMANTVDVGGLSLPPGTYWLDWQANGTLASGPWAPPITLNGQTTTGNGLQSLADNGVTWGPANDGGTGTQQDFPFLIMGNFGCVASDITWVSSDPISGTTSGGSATDVAVTFDSTGLVVGVYTGTLCVNSNDPLTPVITVPLTMTVVPNIAPVAVDDAYNTTLEATLMVAAPGVLANDSDDDGDVLTAVLDTDPSNGSLSLNSDGSFTYTPTAGFVGTDSFTYYANDGLEDSNVATVTITVKSGELYLPLIIKD